MGEVRRSLDRKDEALWNRIPPPKERFLLRQPVEGIGDFRDTEVVGVVLKERFVGKTGGRTVSSSGRNASRTYRYRFLQSLYLSPRRTKLPWEKASGHLLIRLLFLHSGFANPFPQGYHRTGKRTSALWYHSMFGAQDIEVTTTSSGKMDACLLLSSALFAPYFL